MEKQGEDTAPWILGFFHFSIRNPHVRATEHRLNDPIMGSCNDRVVLPNRPEVALLAFLDMDAAICSYCGGSDEKVIASGRRSRAGVRQAAVRE